MKQCVLSESYRGHRLLAYRVLDDGDFSGYCFLSVWTFLIPSASYVAGSRKLKEFTFCGMKVRLWSHQSKEATKEFKILFIGIVYKATWKAMKKKTFIPLPCLPTFLHLRKDQKMIVFDLHLEQWQEQFYIMMLWQYKLYKKCPKLTLHAVAIQAVQKLSKIDLRRKQIFVIFNDCRRYASKCWLLPVDGVFNWRLTNIEAGFILQPFF